MQNREGSNVVPTPFLHRSLCFSFLSLTRNVCSLCCRWSPQQDTAALTGTGKAAGVRSLPNPIPLPLPPVFPLLPGARPGSSLHTETTWVFIGFPYMESWQISGETPACKKNKGKEKPPRWGHTFRGAKNGARLDTPFLSMSPPEATVTRAPPSASQSLCPSNPGGPPNVYRG